VVNELSAFDGVQPGGVSVIYETDHYQEGEGRVLKVGHSRSSAAKMDSARDQNDCKVAKEGEVVTYTLT